MSHILFGLYTLLFGVALFSGEGGHMVFGAVTVLVLIGWLIRNLYLPARVGHYARKYLGFLLILLVVVPYLLLPDLAASIVCYAFVAGWLYGVPGCRLLLLRLVYARAVRAACRRRDYRMECAGGGLIVYTPAKVYDLRFVGSFRRVGVVTLTDECHYTLRVVPPHISREPALLRELLAPQAAEEHILRRWLVGNATRHEITWSELLDDGRSVERVLIFLPGLCEWRFTNGGHAVTNGSTVREITFYEADAFVESRLS